MANNHVYFYKRDGQYYMEIFCNNSNILDDKAFGFTEDNLLELPKQFKKITGQNIYALCDKIGDNLSVLPQNDLVEVLLKEKECYLEHIKSLCEFDFVKELFAITDVKRMLNIVDGPKNYQWIKVTPENANKHLEKFQCIYFF